MDESPNNSCVSTLSILFRHTQMLAGRTFEKSHIVVWMTLLNSHTAWRNDTIQQTLFILTVLYTATKQNQMQRGVSPKVTSLCVHQPCGAATVSWICIICTILRQVEHTGKCTLACPGALPTSVCVPSFNSQHSPIQCVRAHTHTTSSQASTRLLMDCVLEYKREMVRNLLFSQNRDRGLPVFWGAVCSEKGR